MKPKAQPSSRINVHEVLYTNIPNWHKSMGIEWPSVTRKKKMIVVIFLMVCLCSSLSTNAIIRYVKTSATGTGTGLSWANASGDIQTMINASAIGDEVWVTSGTYLPNKEPDGTTNSSRDFCFYLKNGVKLYGGFAGTETATTQRIKGSNITTLSGDIGVSGDSTDNVYHVVISYNDHSTTLLDGFTITKGNANTSGVSPYTIESSALSIPRSIGAGVHAFFANTTISNCEIKNNTSTGHGAGLFTTDGDSVKLISCVFKNNNATGTSNSGGGVYSASITTYTDCSFIDNVGFYGAAITNRDSSLFYNCIFTGNMGSVGGAIRISNATNYSVFRNCTFFNNQASTAGGAIYVGVVLGFNKIKVINSIFWNNIQGTSTTDAGSDIYTISTAEISYSLLQNTYSALNYPTVNFPLINTFGNQNFFAINPQFENSADEDGIDNLLGTLDDGLAIDPCVSPLLNMGTNVGVSATDITGSARIYNTIVDLGAYEGAPTQEINITGNSNSISNGDLTPSTGDHTNFQNVSTGGTLQRVFTIQNNGFRPLIIDNIEIDNVTAGGLFTVSGITLPMSINAFGTSTFTVTFTPTSSGTKTAQVHVYNNDCSESNYTFAIQAASNNASSLHFDGVNDIVDAGTTLGNFGTNDFTIETRFKTSGTTNTTLIGKRGVCSHANFWSLRMIAGKIFGELDQNSSGLNYGSVESPLTYNDGQWHHVAFVRDGIQMYLYMDGTLVKNDSTAATTNLTNAIGLRIGMSPCGYFEGDLDETRIWNRALTLCEIQHNMNCEIPSAFNGLLANYHYNQGLAGVNNSIVNTLTDDSGNGNSGFLQNFALSGATSNWDDASTLTSGNSCAAYIDNEMNVVGNNVTIVDGDITPSITDHSDFGNVVALSSLTRTFTIQNTSVAPLSISSIAMSGTDASLFTIGTYPASIAANSAATFTVTFSPVYTGTKTATITINNNDCDEAVYTFVVQGSGTCTNNGSTTNITACGQYTWNGTTYYSSGVYSSTLTNTTGCDSIATLNLTLGNTFVNKAYIPNLTTDNLSIINLNTNQVIGTVVGFGAPTGVTMHPNGSKVYVGNDVDGKLSVINTNTNTVTTISGGTDLAGVTINPAGTLVYAADQVANVVRVYNTTSNSLIQSIPVGNNPTYLIVHPTLNRLYVTNQFSNTVSVINTTTNSITATINVGSAPRGITITPDGNFVYVVNSSSNSISKINTTTNTISNTISVGSAPVGVAVSQDGTKVFVTNTGSNSVSVINTSTNAIIATIGVGNAPRGVSFSTDGSKAYIVNTNSNNVSIIQVSTNTVIGTIAVGTAPYSVGKFIWSIPIVNITACGSYNWGGTTYTSSGTYTHTFTSTMGCDSVVTVNLTIQALPSVGSTASATAFCAGTSVTLSGTGAATYTWSGGVTNGVAFVPTTTTTYTVTGTNANGCSNTATRSITVNTLPIVGSSTTASSVCSGTSVTLSGTGASTYAWSGGVTNGVAFVPTTTTTYTVTGTNANGCSNTATRSITVNTLPIVGSSTTASSVCSGTSVTLSGTGASTYTWSGSVTNSLAFVPTTTTTYTVTGTDVNGCSNTATRSITVNTLPIVGSSTTASSVCSGTSVTLSGTGAATYTWSGGVTNGVAFVPSTTTTYTVTGTNANGCSNTATQTILVMPCTSTLNLKFYVEGYYMGGGMMQPVLANQGVGSSSVFCDSVLVELRDGITLNLVEAVTTVFHTDGASSCSFTSNLNGSYYIILKYRNTIETWSEVPINFTNGIASYDFSTASSKAYGSNQREVEPNVFAIYSGDISQDGAIDAFDFLLLEPDIIIGNFGYFSSDLNGDGGADTFDYLVLEQNIVLGVSAAAP